MIPLEHKAPWFKKKKKEPLYLMAEGGKDSPTNGHFLRSSEHQSF